MVRFQKSTESLNTDNLALVTFVQRLDYPVYALVNSLLMVVHEEFPEDMSQLLFGRQNEVLETFFLDPAVAPARILRLEPNYEIDEFLGDSRSPRVLAVFAAVVLFGNEFSVPAKNSVWREQFCTLVQDLTAEPFCLGRYSHLLLVGQTNAIAMVFLVFHQDSHLFLQVINRLVEFLVEAVRQTGHECQP